MTPTEKHRETARQVTQAICGMSPCYPEQFEMRDIIAAAIANAEREGMKRAAEILTEYAGENGPANEFDDDGYWRETTALTAASAILLEAGEV